MRREVSILVLALTVLACAGGETGVDLGKAQGAAAGYDVLLVTLDTTRADRIGCYGYAAATTPSIDRLAEHGVRVADAVTVAPVTLPAHASILTGRYPPEHGVRDNGEFVLGPDSVTLAETLQASGYATGAFVSAFVLDGRYGLAQGFDRYDDAVVSAARAGALEDHVDERSAAQTTDAALAWLEGLDASKPAFTWVHYFDPHAPYAPPVEPLVGGDRYDAEIAFVDRELGRLLARLDELGRGARTLTVVVADHGEGLGDHDEETHTLLIYGATMRVPLILHAPGALAAGQVFDGSVASVVDIVPTVLELLGVDDAGVVDGISLAAQPPDPDRLAYMESMVPWLDHGWAPLHGLRRHRDKLILAPAPEYFDLIADRTESSNLWATASGGSAARRDRLDEELAALLAGWPDAAAVAEGVRTLDPEERARLEALGYVGGSEGRGDGAAHDPKTMMPAIRKIDRAKALAATGRFDEALAEIDSISESVGDSRSLLGQLARIYVRVGRDEDAAAVLERYVEIRPSSQALVLLAQVRLTQGRPSEATARLDQAEELDPGYGAIHITRGDLAAASGDLDGARRHYLTAGEVDPYRATPAMRDRLTRLRSGRSR